MAISFAYVSYDLGLCYLELGYTMKQGGDFIIHHLLGIMGAVVSFVGGRFNVALSCGMILSEWTAFSMNHRWRMLKHKQTQGFAFMAINAVFFLSYFLVRVVFMFMLILRNYQVQQTFDIFSDPPLIYCSAVMASSLQLGLYVIQLYWFYLIFGALMRTLQGQKPMIASKDD